jgi:hypothetical protein
MSSGQVSPFLEYTARETDGGTWRVYDPSGRQIMFYGAELDGDLAPTLAKAHAQEKNFELRFMADFLGVSRQSFVEALAACRAEVDEKVAGGVL